MIENKKIEIDSKIIKWVLSSSLISTFIIVLMHNTSIDDYLKFFTIPFSLLLVNYGIIIKLLKPKIDRKHLIYLLPIILILISNLFLEVDFSNLFINFLMLPFLISIFFFSLINKNYFISRTFGRWMFRLFPSGLILNLEYIKKLNIKTVNRNEKTKNIIKGICIGVPIAILLLNLLASADKYFSVFMESINGLFSNISNIDFVFQNAFLFIGFFLVGFTILINVIKHRNAKEEPFCLYNINIDISKTVLIIVNAVFVLFLISEISKITVNFLSVPIEYTYAEYAREGFFQLLFVTLINFGIILYYLYFVKNAENNITIKRLIILLIGFSILLIFNSYYRMFLYIGNYGFTILRLQVILFLLMEFILFIIMLKKIIWKLKRKDSILITSIVVVTYVINLYFCIQPCIDTLNWLLF